ncbi:uncharacterized protein VTP21DRAFT_8866 [Calcarisporiella thermophila]|uniref:uncharacterized protein n=1 Tax=Calcarisporiella thermophila TaxID=911321 RepID=UPI0037439CA2
MQKAHTITNIPSTSSGNIGGTNINTNGGTGGGDGGGEGDKVDYDTLTDVTVYAGVDLKEESDYILRDVGVRIQFDGVDQTRAQQFFNANILRTIVERIAKSNNISNVSQDYVTYLALATQLRLRNITEQMIQAAKHRIKSQEFAPPPLDEAGKPMYKIIVQQDVRKQLLAIERAEREEERRRKEKLAERTAAAEAMGGADGLGGEGRYAEGTGGPMEDLPSTPQELVTGNKPPKKRRKDTRNISEDVRKRITNQTALLSAGGVRKSWMLEGAGDFTSTPTPPVRRSASTISNPGTPPPMSTDLASPSAGGSTNARTPSAVTPSPTTTASGSVSGRRPPLQQTPSLLKRGRSRTSFVLPPSTITRGASGKGMVGDQRVTVRDALFALERDRGAGGGAGTGERVLLKSYTKWLKD